MFVVIPRLLILSASGFYLLLTGPTTCHSPQETTRPESAQRSVESAINLKTVAETPQEYVGQNLTLSGLLTNEGRNYFTDLRVVIQDQSGSKIYVQPWLPVEVPPGPKGGPTERRDVLSNYLGKEVELTAVLERGTLKKLGEVYYLKVKSAKVIE